MECVDSTNSEIRRRIATLDNLSLIATQEQTAGRGQGTHKWYSSPRTNLLFSMLFRFPENDRSELKTRDMLLITEMVTLGIRDYLLDNGISARIKWPNDIWVGERKICGILIEHRTDGRHLSASIIGIGINLDQTAFPPELVNPVSVAVLTEKRFGTDVCLDRFCRIFASRMESVYSKLPHLGNVISGAFALEDGASGDENLRACFAQCVNVLL